MFKQERLIPAVTLVIFAFSVVGLVWGDQLGITGFLSSLPPFVLVAILFIAYVLKMRSVAGEPGGGASWWATILSAAILVFFAYTRFVPQGNDEQQAGFFYLFAGFLTLLLICLSPLDALHRRREKELTAYREGEDVNSQTLTH